MMGPKALIAEIDKVRPPYNISVLNYECALFALEHQDVFAAQAADLVLQRGRLLKALRAMQGLTVWNSDANMILVRINAKQAAEADAAGLVFQRLKASGVLVKNISKMHPLLANCLRLTVGTADENTQLLATLQKAL
jgi:histidinol-phosphate aminotransferase